MYNKSIFLIVLVHNFLKSGRLENIGLFLLLLTALLCEEAAGHLPQKHLSVMFLLQFLHVFLLLSLLQLLLNLNVAGILLRIPLYLGAKLIIFSLLSLEGLLLHVILAKVRSHLGYLSAISFLHELGVLFRLLIIETFAIVLI